ncbi:exonuclease SbcCD subunit D [Thalassotalea sp. HSM 43]|uniref:exonuclease SbcCD subunit D n=1 Tax=Thalassotalea sp. HSM 43 TaxID=2552945 RepID=UPI00108140E9|nr:exonuclease SbcCD subunit D [Thalassotalea sp. HSM 43]QBY05554.1 exonuclease SbcCD subunit D [Thalassotalea sp. HSM 43]
MRFLHTSDWHIGRLFQNQSLLDDQQYVLAQIKRYLVEYQVDALIIAGDVFDRSVPPAEAVQILDDFINEIQQLNVTTIMISGNHDSAKRLRFGAKQMQHAGVHILADLADIEQPVIVEKAGQKVAFYGVPYHDPSEVRLTFKDDDNAQTIRSYDQAHSYCAQQILAHKNLHHSDMAAVLISHCFLDGASESDSERPLSIGGADRVSWQPLEPFDYVALGHLHGPQYKGKPHIRYSGSLLKYSFSEYKQQKAVTLVELESGKDIALTSLPLTAKRDVKVLEGTLQQLIEQGQNHITEHGKASDDYYLAKLTDTEIMLDPMGQLRSVYPNILQLERVNFAQSEQQHQPIAFDNQKSEADVFAEFYQQVMGMDLSQPQRDLLHSCIDQAKQHQEGE